MTKDPLQLVPVERWSELQAILLRDYPRGLPGYNTLETQLRYLKNGFDYGFKVYSLFEDLDNGFIALNYKENKYEFIIQYLKDDTNVLEEVLRTTKVIDWDTPITLAFIGDHVIEAVEQVIKEKEVELDLLPSYTFILEKGSPLFEDVSLPPGFTFELLSSKYVDLIDSKWPHRYPGSAWYFQLLVDTKSGYGLFKNDQLVCWILISECGQLTHLYTMEDYRKQGFAELVLKLVSNELLKVNRQVYVFCVRGNDNACKLYRKLNFKESTKVSWGYLNKKSS